MASPATTSAADRDAFDPVSAEVEQVAREVGVDPARGLSADEARSRLESHGPNRLAGGTKEPGWKAFLRQYQDFMQVILLGAALVNQLVTGDTGPMHVATAVGTPVVAIFGASNPVRYGPRGHLDRIVRVELPCSPCNRIRLPPQRCAVRTPDCLAYISPSRVFDATVSALSASTHASA